MSNSCACRGIRFCAICKDSERVKKMRSNDVYINDKFNDYTTYVYNINDGKCYLSSDIFVTSSLDIIKKRTLELQSMSDDELSKIESFPVNGLLVIRNFINESEEEQLLNHIEKTPWIESQSGRRKQDYGPKVNFKGKKIKCEKFIGVPEYADDLLQRMTERSLGILKDYQPFELCNLEYVPERLSSIELHQDDSWIWGNRLISLNLLNDSVMTYENDQEKKLFFVLMERKSLLSMYDDARYIWKHGIFAHHIPGRRIALTMREPSNLFKPGGELYEEYGKELISRGNIRIKII